MRKLLAGVQLAPQVGKKLAGRKVLLAALPDAAWERLQEDLRYGWP